MNRRGVTLIEMLVVVAIVGVIAGISFPSVASGLDNIRLASASDAVASFLNSALNRADRREQVMEVVIAPKENTIFLYSTEPGFEKKLAMPSGVTIAGEEPRRFLLQPGGTVPRIAIELNNRRGTRKIVRVDPITGVPRIETPRETS